MDWHALKSGSDIRGVAIGENAVLTPEAVWKVGAAFAEFLAKKTGRTSQTVCISIGRDSRITGEVLEEAMSQGVAAAGSKAFRYGLCTTPAMFVSTIEPSTRMDGAVMVSASHHPYHLNGLKFFTADGGLSGQDITELLNRAEAVLPETLPQSGSVQTFSFLEIYAGILSRMIQNAFGNNQKPLRGLHAVVDAGNGSGGFYADVLKNLGADTDGSQFLEPDGMFPNHIPNPENEAAMEFICDAVKKAKADLGVIFDTDCDRAAIVDAQGNEINRNRLIALISAILLREKPGETIVTDSVTSSGLADFIKSHGGIHHRFKRGYRNVIDEAVRLNESGRSCPLAIETSGHAALRENYFLDDGMYLVTWLIIEAMKFKLEGKNISDIIRDLKEPKESAEIRLSITRKDFRMAGKSVIEAVSQYAKYRRNWHIAPDNFEGIRVGFDLNGGSDNGWFLLRMSVHDPVLPLNVESDIDGGVKAILEMLLPVLQAFSGVDLNSAYRYLADADKEINKA